MKLLSNMILLLVTGSGSLMPKDCGSGERDFPWKGLRRNAGRKRTVDLAGPNHQFNKKR